MSERYKFVEGHAHFITFAVVGKRTSEDAYSMTKTSGRKGFL
jgi:hypothetical protein